MRKMMEMAKGFMRDEEGATAVEYGVLVALIIAACVVIIGTLGEKIQSAFQGVSDSISG